MEVVFPRCAGLDVHKKTVTACCLVSDSTGQTPEGVAELRPFGPMTRDRLALADWLVEAGITHIAMESPGEYWKPVYNLLEDTVTIFLVHASHVQNVPGRKTDPAAARWLAKLMRYGWLQASFLPPVAQRDLRDWTRYRTKLVQERAREVNRVQGVLERANIKLASVASDVLGVSGRAMLEALIAGEADPATMAALAKRRMRSKIPVLEQALTGTVRDHHRRLLTLQLGHIDFLDAQIAALNNPIAECVTTLNQEAGVDTTPPSLPSAAVSTPMALLPPLTFTRAVELLDTIPGGNQRGAEMIVAEIGIAMTRCGTAARLAAWAGVVPGPNESAGKQRSGKTRTGNQVLRAGLTQLAHGAVRPKGTYVSAWYRRLAARRGKRRAILAVAHSIMVRVFPMLTRNDPYRELGANSFDERRRHDTVDRLLSRIEHLGYRVHLEPVAAPAGWEIFKAAG
jgi:transposase